MMPDPSNEAYLINPRMPRRLIMLGDPMYANKALNSGFCFSKKNFRPSWIWFKLRLISLDQTIL